MKQHNVSRLMALLWLLLPGCAASSSLTKVWKNPNLKGQIHFNKVVALAIHDDINVCRQAEDEMARQIGSNAVPAYSILSEPDRHGDLRGKLEAAGADGVVTMKLLDRRTENTYSPADSYGAFYEGDSPRYSFASGSSGSGGQSSGSSGDFSSGSTFGAAGYTYSNAIFTVETKIYSLKDGQVIWWAISQSETGNPQDVPHLIADIAKAIRVELEKEMLVPSSGAK